jgi:histidine triad (HIT) family protein
MDCIFCRIIQKTEPAFVVYEDDICLAILDKYPQTRGHIQLIPKKHFRYIYDAPEMGEIFDRAQKIIRGIISVLGADHVTIGTFGQQISHAHIWIVPQYGSGVHLVEKSRKMQSQDNQKLALILKNAIVKEV